MAKKKLTNTAAVAEGVAPAAPATPAATPFTPKAKAPPPPPPKPAVAPTTAAPAAAAPQDDLTEAERNDLANAGIDETAALAKRERNELFREIAKIGRDYGAGKVSLIALAETVVDGASHTTIKEEDAEDIYERFKKAANDRATIDGDNGSVTVPDNDKSLPQQLSKLRRFIKLGAHMTNDASDVLRRARNIHVALVIEDKAQVKYSSVYTAMYELAGVQIKNAGVPLSDVEIRKVLVKDVTEDTKANDAGKKVLDTYISALSAIRGTAERPPIPDNQNLLYAADYLRLAVGDIAPNLLKEFEDKQAAKEKAAADAAAKKAANQANTATAPLPTGAAQPVNQPPAEFVDTSSVPEEQQAPESELDETNALMGDEQPADEVEQATE